MSSVQKNDVGGESLIERVTSVFRGLLKAPLEPLLHPTRGRILTLAFFLILGHPIFYLIWTYMAPQQYESLAWRLACTFGAIPLLFLSPEKIKARGWSAYLALYTMLTGPLIFVWFYLMNDGSPGWMTSLCAMVLIYYQVVDWRIASRGMVVSLVITLIGYWLVRGDLPNLDVHIEGLITSLFAWVTALLLATSNANLQIQRLQSTMSTMGVMAHELRTPLASASLLADNLRSIEDPRAQRISQRMNVVIRTMHHQIDSQIVNAQLLHQVAGTEEIGAQAVVQNAVDTYPFKHETERQRVIISTERDFVFQGSSRLFTQVLHNLLKNALFALQKTGRTPVPGDIRITIGSDGKKGRIRFADNGPGIPNHIRKAIFEPFYSTQTSYSSGLGLAFSRQTIEANGGKIALESPKTGTSFLIEFPVVTTTSPNMVWRETSRIMSSI